MALTKMMAIEYNMWMSIMKLIKDTVSNISFGTDSIFSIIKVTELIPPYYAQSSIHGTGQPVFDGSHKYVKGKTITFCCRYGKIMLNGMEVGVHNDKFINQSDDNFIIDTMFDWNSFYNYTIKSDLTITYNDNGDLHLTEINNDGGFDLVDIPVLPAYPRNLTTFTKPSIIVQKVSTDNAPLCFGGFIGQHYDEEKNEIVDVFGVNYESTYQIDVCGDNNTQRSLITAAITDELINNIRFRDNGQIEIYNYALSLNNPQLMGYAKLDQTIDVQNLDKKYRSDNEYKLYNYDYTTAIRFDMSMLQVVIPEQQLVDLTKWIKINQQVRI